MALERLQKIIAEAGITSRRQAEFLIRAGRVKVNGQIIKLGDKADPLEDKIYVDGKKLDREKKWYLAFYKPRNVVTTLYDPEDRPTIKDYLNNISERLYPICRLD